MKPATALLASLSPLVLLVHFLGAAQMDGKTLFTKKGCDMCHTVESAGIPLGSTAADKLHINWTRGENCPDCTPDLSTIGDRRKDPKWLKAYLRNQKKGRNGLRHDQLPMLVDGEPIIGPNVFATIEGKLTDEEADALVSWLMTLKKQ